MNKIIKIIGSVFCGALLLGTIVLSNPGFLTATSLPQASGPQIRVNSMTRGTWDVSVDGVEFMSNASNTTKAAVVLLTISNPAGRDKDMLPTGAITAFTGKSGKVYSDFSNIVKFGDIYDGTKQSRKEAGMITGNKAYEAGVFKLGVQTFVDPSETGIASVTYTDENGVNIDIPVSITPIVKTISSSAK